MHCKVCFLARAVFECTSADIAAADIAALVPMLCDNHPSGAAVGLAAPGTSILSDSLTYFNNNTAAVNLWRSETLAGTSMVGDRKLGGWW